MDEVEFGRYRLLSLPVAPVPRLVQDGPIND
jgi:hypothetical protein